MWGDIRYPKSTWNFDKVFMLFNSALGPNPRGELATYQYFVDLLSSGDLGFELHTITCRPRPDPNKKGTDSNKDWKVFRKCKRGGGDFHGWLKWWAYNWMAAQSDHPVGLEVSFKGYGRVDLYSEQLSSFIECGNTSPTHALYALRNGLCSRFFVLPFQRSAFENMGLLCYKNLEAYSFHLLENTNPVIPSN